MIQMSTEEKLIKHFDKKYGRSSGFRLDKLKEECMELFDAIENYELYCNDQSYDHLLDEMSDVLAVITHVASIFNGTSDDLLELAIEKSEKRVFNPKYKKH